MTITARHEARTIDAHSWKRWAKGGGVPPFAPVSLLGGPRCETARHLFFSFVDELTKGS